MFVWMIVIGHECIGFWEKGMRLHELLPNCAESAISPILSYRHRSRVLAYFFSSISQYSLFFLPLFNEEKAEMPVLLLFLFPGCDRL